MKRAIASVCSILLSCSPRSHAPEPGTDFCGDVKHVVHEIVNGVDAPEAVSLTDGQIKAVGALNLDFSGVCSGVLVAPDVVLTAAHCVEAISGDPTFLVGDSYMPPEATFRGVEWYVHPLYTGDPAYDIAVIIISGDPLSEGIEPIPASFEPTSLLAQTVQAVGYGMTDPAGDWNTRRWWTTHEVISESPAIYIASGHGASGLCQGDSGGPMLYTMPAGVRVMGVASSIDSEDCLGNAYYARTDAVAEWLQGYITEDPCGAETLTGRCQGDVAIWCEDGETYYHACADFGYTCGLNPDGLYRCVTPCGAETLEGRCQGDLAVWCEGEEIFYHSCADFGYVCGHDADGNHRCIPPSACEGITLAGICEDDTAIWCEEGELWYHDCADFGYHCALDGSGNHRCLSECDFIGFAGVCDGDIARWCVGHTIFERDCAACDQTCGWTGDLLGNYCL